MFKEQFLLSDLKINDHLRKRTKIEKSCSLKVGRPLLQFYDFIRITVLSESTILYDWCKIKTRSHIVKQNFDANA